MIIQSLMGFGNRRDGAGNARVNFGDAHMRPGQARRELRRSLEESQNNMLKEAHNRIQEQAREQRDQQRRRQRRRTGAVRVSNTDSVGRAMQVRARLLAKLQEVHGSDMEERSRGAAAMDIKLQIDRVERQISAIRRRERAIREEQTTRRSDDSPEARRRRFRDMQERRIYIRRDFLYHANNGGWDPNDPLFSRSAGFNAMSSVAFEMGGSVGNIDTVTPEAGMEVDFSMDVAL
jgi:hypothetical protein